MVFSHQTAVCRIWKHEAYYYGQAIGKSQGTKGHEGKGLSLLCFLMVMFVSSLAGPWFVGELIDGQMGACFSFGVFVGGSFFQGSMTFVVGILQVSIYKTRLKTSFFTQGLFNLFFNNFIKKGVLEVESLVTMPDYKRSFLPFCRFKGQKGRRLCIIFTKFSFSLINWCCLGLSGYLD